MVHNDVCPLCSSDKIFLFLRCIDHFISKEEFDIYKCAACDFVFTQDYPEESKMGEYYESEDYISHSDTSIGFTNKIYQLARNVMLRKKRGIIRNVTGRKEGNLLDIGSGTGYFAGTMKDAGWMVKGIEINVKAREFSISRFGLDVIDPINISSLKKNTFDCITLWHVLEHFHDPFKFISEILPLLKPGGTCLIALPNYSSYDANYYRQYWAAYDVPRHHWHFNPATFRIFSNKTGLIVEKIKSLPLDVFYISSLSEKYKDSKLAFLAGIFKAMPFALLSVFKKERSSSVIYVLRKA